MRKNVEHEASYSIQNLIGRLFRNKKPIAKLFRTNNSGYLYDTGTNKIVACDDIEFFILVNLFSLPIDEAISSISSRITAEQLDEAIQRIHGMVEREKILLTQEAKHFGLSAHFRDYEEFIDSSLKHVQLEITEKCNLRCGYCIYNSFVPFKRNHSDINMSINVAHKAIEYLWNHSHHEKKTSISFYGGEPLLRFRSIKDCVSYAENRFVDRNLHYSITTNGTLMTPDMAEYFFKHNFSLVFSIDGPEEIHDGYRKDSKGQGSFARAFAGLRTATQAYGSEAKNRILLSMVYAPPFSTSKLDRILELWDRNPSLLGDIQAMITYPSRGTVPIDKIAEGGDIENRGLLEWACERYMADYKNKHPSPPLIRQLIEKKLAKLFQRPIFDEPIDKYHLNGCCIPGVRKLFVTTRGIFHICERVSSYAPSIGDVYFGINKDEIKKTYIDGYATSSLASCSKCWALRLCQMCYATCVNDKGIDLDMKNLECDQERQSQEYSLRFYCELLEVDKSGLDFLNDIVLE